MDNMVTEILTDHLVPLDLVRIGRPGGRTQFEVIRRVEVDLETGKVQVQLRGGSVFVLPRQTQVAIRQRG